MAKKFDYSKLKIEVIVGNELSEKEIQDRVNTFQNTFVDVASKYYSEKFLKKEKLMIKKSQK